MITVVGIVATACGGDSSDGGSSDYAEPGRVDIRQGLYDRSGAVGDANFSAVLPEGWRSVDTLNRPLFREFDTPRGTLAKLGMEHGSLNYSLVPPGTDTETRVFPGYEAVVTDVDGVQVSWMLPEEPIDPDDRVRVRAVFPSLPGDPNPSFGLVLDGSGITSADFEEVKAIINSIRHAVPPPDPPTPPQPLVTPGPDWSRVSAHWRDDPEKRVFSVLAPPGSTYSYVGSFDSFAGDFSVNGVTIAFDYGSAASDPLFPHGFISDPDYFPEHQVWVEKIDGKLFQVFRPAEEDPGPRAYTGVSVARIPGLPDIVPPDGSYSSVILDCGGGFWARSVTREEQELVLAVLRTIRAEEWSGDCR